MDTSQIASGRVVDERLSTILAELSRKKMNVAELAKAIGISHNSIYNWINGTQHPISENYNKLADFFGWPHFKEGENQ